MANTVALEERVASFLREEGLAERKVVAAVSGGPDSLALLLALERLRLPLRLELHVAHLDHGLRPESRAEASYVRRVARRLGLAVTVGREDVRALRRAHHLSLEEAARRARYAFLGRVAREAGAVAVLTGHTADDQAETVLLHLLRGSGLGGLGGMAPMAPLPSTPAGGGIVVARPLLSTWRWETEAYCQKRRLRPRRDPSNQDRGPLRNRVRLDLLPRMDEARPGAKEALLRLANTASQAEDYLDRAAREALERQARWEEGAVALEVGSILSLHPALRAALLRRAARELAGDPPPLEQVHIEEIERLLGRPEGGSLDFPRGLLFTVAQGRAMLSLGPPPCPLPLLEERDLAIPGETLAGGWRFQARQGEGALLLAASMADVISLTSPLLPHPLAARLDGELAAKGLRVRPRRPGDRLRTSGGTRKLQDLLVDARVPRLWRDRVPVVCRADTGEVVWVVGVHGPLAPRPVAVAAGGGARERRR